MISIKKKASYKDLSIIAGNIGKLYDEGISLLNILNLIDELPLKREYKVLLKQMEKVIKEGGSLSDGFKSGGELIPSFFSSMVNIGEITGKIVYVLKGLETFYDKLYNVKKSIINAITYPLFLLAALFLLGIFVIFFFIPSMSEIYLAMGKDIPLIYVNIITLKESFFNNPIIVTIQLSIVFIIENYFISLESCYRDDKFDNALLYIDTLCNSNGIISIEENKIFTEKLTKDIKSNNIVVTTKEINEDRSVKIIYLKDNNLKVRTLNYKGKNVTVGDNILLDKVNEFNVKRKKNLVYYYIKNNEYKLRGRCI